MSKLQSVLVAVAGAGLLTALPAGPAAANDASITVGAARATYTDSTDNLCARITSTYSWTEWAQAQIVNISNGNVVFGVTDNEGGGQTCTGNLSIQEDKQFYLRVTECGNLPGQGTKCVSKQETFFS